MGTVNEILQDSSEQNLQDDGKRGRFRGNKNETSKSIEATDVHNTTKGPQSDAGENTQEHPS